VNVLDLFSGIGCFSLGLERAGMRTVAFCEQEPYCQAVLRKHWPNVPIYGDVRELTAARLISDGIRPDVICGGFPCQDISIAGDGAGLAGEQSGLWAEFLRLICDLRPRFVLVENVAEICTRGLGELVGQLSDVGYDAEWEGIPAAAIGAVHLRSRQWILAYPSSLGDRLAERTILPRRIEPEHSDWWSSERGIPRVDDGARNRLQRHRALGNAVVWGIPYIIGRAVMNALDRRMNDG
jgi:DNA (cytosine-5)-methyltransferase 1